MNFKMDLKSQNPFGFLKSRQKLQRPSGKIHASKQFNKQFEPEITFFLL